jgi:hypothetical protein
LAAVVFDLAVYAGIDRLTVESTAPRLADLDAVPSRVADRLSAAGIRTPPDLLRRAETAAHLPALAARAGLTEVEIAAARQAARLADLKGMGARNANALRRLGIHTVEELARHDAVALAARWEASGDRVPPVARVRIWVRAARAQAASRPESPSSGPAREAARMP